MDSSEILAGQSEQIEPPIALENGWALTEASIISAEDGVTSGQARRFKIDENRYGEVIKWTAEPVNGSFLIRNDRFPLNPDARFTCDDKVDASIRAGICTWLSRPRNPPEPEPEPQPDPPKILLMATHKKKRRRKYRRSVTAKPTFVALREIGDEVSVMIKRVDKLIKVARAL